MSIPSTNLSIFAIPVYWALTLAPHAVAISSMRAANNNQWDNSNPRSTTFATKLSTTTPKATFARFERAEAAHKNGMENLPLVIAAVVLGNMTGLQGAWLNGVLGGYLLSRVLYTLLYINIEDVKKSYARSLVWGLGTGLLGWIIISAGNAAVQKS